MMVVTRKAGGGLRRGAARLAAIVVVAAASVLLSASLMVSSAFAQGGFLDQGRGLLEGLGVTGQRGDSAGDSDLTAGLKEALRVGSGRVIDRVGGVDGFNGDPDIHIPLPGALGRVGATLERVGLGGLTQDLELRLNRAAERAAPEARELFIDAIADMTLADAQRIYDGPDDAATQYFRGRMSAPLTDRMTPIVEDSLADVGAMRAYDRVMTQYRAIPLVPSADVDLTGYVVDKALDGIFFYLAREEAAIRNNPAARTTELLKKVFGG